MADCPRVAEIEDSLYITCTQGRTTGAVAGLDLKQKTFDCTW